MKKTNQRRITEFRLQFVSKTWQFWGDFQDYGCGKGTQAKGYGQVKGKLTR